MNGDVMGVVIIMFTMQVIMSSLSGWLYWEEGLLMC